MEGTVITMPAVALRGLTVFPAMMIHFDINRKRSVAAVEKAMVSEGIFGDSETTRSGRTGTFGSVSGWYHRTGETDGETAWRKYPGHGGRPEESRAFRFR